jgi:ABC-type transporter Mla maintaining outer membrane lipid asymmetry ATPase subunit MlaF
VAYKKHNEYPKNRLSTVSNNDIAIKATDLTKCYGSVIALDHLNLEVQKGEILGYLGS